MRHAVGDKGAGVRQIARKCREKLNELRNARQQLQRSQGKAGIPAYWNGEPQLFRVDPTVFKPEFAVDVKDRLRKGEAKRRPLHLGSSHDTATNRRKAGVVAPRPQQKAQVQIEASAIFMDLDQKIPGSAAPFIDQL
jgi:hypothetical protein